MLCALKRKSGKLLEMSSFDEARQMLSLKNIFILHPIQLVHQFSFLELTSYKFC